MGTYHIPASGINFTHPLIVLYRIGSDLDELAVLAINKMIQVQGPNIDAKMWGERETETDRDRESVSSWIFTSRQLHMVTSGQEKEIDRPRQRELELENFILQGL